MNLPNRPRPKRTRFADTTHDVYLVVAYLVMIAVLILGLTGCASTRSQHVGVSSVTATYQSAAVVQAEERQRAAARMEPTSKYRQQSNGRVVLHIRGLTIESANTERFIYVLRHNGQEVYRQQGAWNIPEVPGLYSSYWWNIDVLPVPVQVNQSTTLHVIDRIHNRRADFNLVELGA